MTTHLGFYNTSSTRTHVRLQFSTLSMAGGNIAPLSAFEAADIRIYKATDGAAFSATQRSSSNGITMTSPFDSLTGFHDVDIDLTDNTDAGFYASGSFYSIILAPDTETIDGQTITGIPLGYFEIGVAKADVTQFGGTGGTFSGGRPEVNTTLIEGSDATNQIRDSIVSDATRFAGANIDATVSSRLATSGYTTPPTANENADALLKRDWTSVTGEAARSVLNALRKLRNKVSFNGTDTLTITKEDDTTTAYTQPITSDTDQNPFKSVG